MRHWKPKQEDKTPLPAPPLAYHERETAMAWGYQLGQWELETVNRRAQCVAHYLHRLLRESYAAEKAMMKSDKKSGGGASYNSLMKAMGLPS